MNKTNYEGLTFNQLAERNAEHVTDIGRLEAQVKQLAVENAALKAAFAPKEIPTQVMDVFSDTAILKIDGDEFHSRQWVDNEEDVILAVLEAIKPETPATEAYAASLRAEGVEMLADHHQSIVDKLDGDSLFGDGTRQHLAIAAAATYFAAQLRSKSEVQS